jgi:GxxExxY protein
MNQDELVRVGGVILDASICVHRELGPGLLESAYVISLAHELQLRGLSIKTQVAVELNYKGVSLGKAYVMDILVENEIVVEVKAAETINPVYIAQLITYLKLSQHHLGYLINFNMPLLKDGFRRVFNHH